MCRAQSAGVPDNYVTTTLANSQVQSGRRRLAQQPAPAPQPGGSGGSASNLAVNSQARQHMRLRHQCRLSLNFLGSRVGTVR